MTARDEILRRFESSVMTREEFAEIDGIRSAFRDTADWLLNVTAPGREQALALTALEEAMHWAIRAVVIEKQPADDEMRANLDAILDDDAPSAPIGDGQGPASPARVSKIVDTLQAKHVSKIVASLQAQGVAITPNSLITGATRGLAESEPGSAAAKVSAIDEHRTRSNRRVIDANANGTDPAAPFANGGFTGGHYEPAGIVHHGSFHFPFAAADPSSPPTQISISGQDLHEALLASLPVSIRDSIVPNEAPLVPRDVYLQQVRAAAAGEDAA